MNLVKPRVEVIEHSNPFKLVERVGRTCYRSEDAITDDSYQKFVTNLMDRRHFAMLEHGRVEFGVRDDGKQGQFLEELVSIPGVELLRNAPDEYYLNVSLSHLYNPKWDDEDSYPYTSSKFDTMRHLLECAWWDDAKSYTHRDIHLIPKAAIPVQHRYLTLKFTCDRGVSHELVRHRCALAQESTRYCNYTKAKFGAGDISFVYPTHYDDWDADTTQAFQDCLKQAEAVYNRMVENGYTPQQARAVLPNALRTEVVMTMSIPQWRHFFDLRYFGTTGDPHPDMKRVAGIAYELYKEAILEDFKK